MTLNLFHIDPTPARVDTLRIICERLGQEFSISEFFKEIEKQELDHSQSMVLGTLGLFMKRGIVKQVTTGGMGARKMKFICTIRQHGED